MRISFYFKELFYITTACYLQATYTLYFTTSSVNCRKYQKHLQRLRLELLIHTCLAIAKEIQLFFIVIFSKLSVSSDSFSLSTAPLIIASRQSFISDFCDICSKVSSLSTSEFSSVLLSAM